MSAPAMLPDIDGLVAKSPAMRRVLALADRVAAVDAPVLLTGESGSGKERVARYIHARSTRASSVLIPVNCGALPEPLLESELFGHIRGAFTGADRDHAGLFEAATGGVLLLDEVGEMSLAIQAKLLRVLQEGEIRRVGSTNVQRVDVRIIAATNRDLEDMVRSKAFRRDLYYRLKVISIEIPPLRMRREDILPLLSQFMEKSCRTYRCGPCSLTPDTLDRLLDYPWPGNVRELWHAIERAIVLAEGKPQIQLDDLPPEILIPRARQIGQPGDEGLTLAEVERRHILSTLQRCGNNRREAARLLAISTNTLWRKLRDYGIVTPRGAPRA